jgi:hypothetical protein
MVTFNDKYNAFFFFEKDKHNASMIRRKDSSNGMI